MIPREENSWVDALAKLASAKVVINNKMIIQEMLQTSYIEKVMNVEEEESWMINCTRFKVRQVTWRQTRGKNNRALIGILLHRKWLALQKGFYIALALLHESQGSQLRVKGNTQGNLWESPDRSLRCPHGCLVGILLANDEARCVTACAKLR